MLLGREKFRNSIKKKYDLGMVGVAGNIDDKNDEDHNRNYGTSCGTS